MVDREVEQVNPGLSQACSADRMIPSDLVRKQWWGDQAGLTSVIHNSKHKKWRALSSRSCSSQVDMTPRLDNLNFLSPKRSRIIQISNQSLLTTKLQEARNNSRMPPKTIGTGFILQKNTMTSTTARPPWTQDSHRLSIDQRVPRTTLM